MTNPAVAFALGILAFIALYFLVVLIVSGFSFDRIKLAMRCELRALRDPEFKAKVEPLLAPTKPVEAKPARPSGTLIRLLAVLQREGRLVDFLLENIQGYGDADVGAAVRDIHGKCQAALKEHLTLEPVLGQAEHATVEVPPGFDPSAIRLTGNVTGQPPFRGTLQHHGWRVADIRLAPPPEGQDELILTPAEVELP